MNNNHETLKCGSSGRRHVVVDQKYSLGDHGYYWPFLMTKEDPNYEYKIAHFELCLNFTPVIYYRFDCILWDVKRSGTSSKFHRKRHQDAPGTQFWWTRPRLGISRWKFYAANFFWPCKNVHFTVISYKCQWTVFLQCCVTNDLHFLFIISLKCVEN